MRLVNLFEQQVKKNPEKLSIVSDNWKYSFRELDAYANRVSYGIVQEEVQSNRRHKRISLCFSQGCDMIAAMVGVLKSGNGYVPIDPNYPDSRIIHIIMNSESQLVLTDNQNYGKTLELKKILKEEHSVDINVLNIETMELEDDEGLQGIQREPSDDEQLGYILYTSGSTGVPKGVMQTQENVAHFIKNYIKTLDITDRDRLTLFSTYCHDASVMDIYSALLSGATLYIKDLKALKSMAGLTRMLNRNQITIWHSVPTVYRTYLRDTINDKVVDSVKYVVLGGEEVIAYDVQNFKSRFPKSALYNLYGQTESSYNSGELIESAEYTEDLTIGEVVEDTEILLLNEDGEEVDTFDTGEIVIVNGGISPGYWKNEALTEEVFYDESEDERFYFTGDLGKMLPDGKIMFMGRKDNQIKLRGYRIDLGEIETHILNQENVAEAAVVSREDEEFEKYLVAFVVPKNGSCSDRLRVNLGSKLPDYMLPAHFIELESLPRTTTGKLNRKELVSMDIESLMGLGGREIIPPSNEVEACLIGIFKDILNIKYEIGIKESFFELGGHSLKANKLRQLIYKELEVEVPLMEVFRSPTIEKLAEVIGGTESKSYDAIASVGQKEYYPMSSVQERLYTAYEFDKNSLVYNMPKLIKFKGEIDKEQYKNALEQLVRRHDALRTNFDVKDEKFVQRVHSFEETTLDFEYYTAKGSEDIERIGKEFVRPFDLTKDLLFRCGLIQCPDNEYVVMIDTHHIICDGSSNTLLFSEYNQLYMGVELEENKLRYVDFSSWENNKLLSNEWESSKQYWKNAFVKEYEEIKMPYDFKVDKTHPNYQKADQLEWLLEGNLFESLSETATKNKGTIYMVMVAALNMVMGRFANSEDIIISSPNAGRYHPELEKMIGVFINLVPLRNYPKGELEIGEFLNHVIENTQNAMDNAKYPYQKILNEVLDEGRNIQGSITKVSLNYLNMYEGDEGKAVENTPISVYNDDTLKNDIDITAFKVSEGIKINFKYDKSLFAKVKMETFLKNFILCLESMGSDLSTKLEQVEFTKVTATSNQGVIDDFNGNLRETFYDTYGKGTMQSRLQEAFEKHRARIAVEFGNTEYTYHTLDMKSDVIAQLLKEKGVSPGAFVGVHLTDPVEILTTLLGILKSRAVFVPLNPEFPNQRIKHMVQGTNIEHILTSKELEKELVENIINEIPCEAHRIDAETYESMSYVSGWGEYSEQDELYVCFTSGTTGIPKAIVGINESLKSFIEWEINCFGLNKDTRVSQVSAYSNDAYFRDIFSALFVGGQISIPPQKVAMMSAESIVSWVDNSKINLLHCTPSLFALINSELLTKDNYKGLKHVLLAGEPIIPNSLTKWYKLFDDRIQIVNLYGASETTLIRMFYPIQPEDVNRVKIPIGQAIDGTKVILLNGKGNVCSLGEVGEIYVRTPFMTKGYFNDRELTNSKFIQNPFSEVDDCVYRSGDHAVQLADGDYVFEGRVDDQVKIRGNRVELLAISNLLNDYEGIENAVVTLKEDKNQKTICAYMVASEEVTVDAVRKHLKSQLADYMIPSYFVMVDEFKLNANGKIDKKILPKPERVIKNDENYVAPRTKAEKQVENGWRKVLEIKGSIGIKDNFFEVGGHSILMLKLADNLRRTFELEELSLIDLYENPTIEEMAGFITSSENECKIFYELTKGKDHKATIYAVPYMGGDASCYGALAREFDKQNGQVKIMSTSIFDIGSEVDGEVMTVEKFAKIRAKEILDQGEENIFLLGHCGGSILAVALADELRKMKVKVNGIFVSGLVPTREPNKIVVEAEKRRDFRQFIGMLRRLGFSDRLNVTVAKRYKKAILEMVAFRYRRRKKIHYRIFKHMAPIFSIVADRDPETFNHKRGYKKWRKFSFKVKHVVIESKSHYFISRNADRVVEEITKSIGTRKGMTSSNAKGPVVNSEVISETVTEKIN